MEGSTNVRGQRKRLARVRSTSRRYAIKCNICRLPARTRSYAPPRIMGNRRSQPLLSPQRLAAAEWERTRRAGITIRLQSQETAQLRGPKLAVRLEVIQGREPRLGTLHAVIQARGQT